MGPPILESLILVETSSELLSQTLGLEEIVELTGVGPADRYSRGSGGSNGKAELVSHNEVLRSLGGLLDLVHGISPLVVVYLIIVRVNRAN